MKIKYGFKKLICFVSSVLLSWNILAAPGILEDIPLNVSTNVQPNILFLLDDSGSMDWEVLKSTSAVNSVNTIFVNGTVLAADLNACTSGAFNFNFNAGGTLGVFLYGSSGNIDFSPDTNTFIGLSAGPDNFTCRITLVAPGQDDAAVSELLNLCRGYNVTAFDPEIAANGGYTHWAGVDQTATAYSNRSLATAYINPYFGNVAANIANATNLAEPVTDHFYFVWNDPIAAGGDGDEQYDDNECGDDFPTYDADSNGILSLAECTALGTTVCQPVATIPAGSITLDDGTTQSVDMQEQYANWYTYYRKREYVAKRALSEIIDDSVSRMGMATLHNNSVDGGGVGTIIQDMQNLSLKNTLMNSLFRVDSNNGTPLRRNLEQAGEYFREAGGAGGVGNLFGATPAHTGTLNATTPLLTANEGGSCQQNFAVVFSDGYWNGIGTDVPSVGNTDGPVASGGNTIWDGGTFADDFSNTLADVAMHYLEHDLSPVTLENDLNIVDQNQENTRINHQHLTTYTVAFGVDGTLTTNPNVADSSFTWPDPITNTQEERVDDIRHAAWNGRGEYLNASNPQSLINSLTSAIADIDDRTGTASAASISSGFISSATLIFQSTFNTFDWSGDLLAYRFDEDGVVNLDTSTDTVDVSGNTVTEIDALDAIWSAAERLGAASNSDRINRAIYSYNGRQGVSFDFPDDYEDLLDGSNTDTDTLSDEQIEELLENAPHSSSTVDATEIDENQDYGEQIVDYLKGDATNEVGAGGLELFRGRNNKYLNAIINASPQYVGPPNDIYPNLIEGVGSEYSTFKTTNATRTPVVYVGGNNGMLHAFNASLNPDASVPSAAGRELFAYVPGTLLENNLHTLAETDYSHLAYVDATPTIRDVYVGGVWKTYLVGGLRSGGQGIYILDVTDPDNFSETDVLAEFSHPELGATYSRPQIIKTNEGGRWAAVFGNGYNNASCDSSGNSCGTAKLFILYLDNLPTSGSPFVENTHYRIIRTTAGSVAAGAGADCFTAGSDCNGLSPPVVADLNGDFITDRVYAGDLHGNLWAFNLQGTSGSWGISFGGAPLFTACGGNSCSVSNRQPITVKPEIALHPIRRSFSTAPNVLVYFGTGQFITTNDPVTNDLQTFYAVWDAGSSDPASTYGNLNRTNLQEQTFNGTSVSSINISSNGVDYVAASGVISDGGWYIDLTLQISGNNVFEGGRSVINPVLSGRLIFFLMTIPAGEACNRDGLSYLIALDSFDGTEADFNIFDTDNDGVADSSSPVTPLENAAVGIGTVGVDPQLVITGADGSIGVKDITNGATVPAGRKSWSIIQ